MALTSFLVNIPSLINKSSSSPGCLVTKTVSGELKISMAMVLKPAPGFSFHDLAIPSIRLSEEPPICSKTVIWLFPNPCSVKSSATSRGEFSSLDKIIIFASGCK